MPDPQATRRPPHAALTKYYRGDADRRAFVSTLFDGAAGHYDRVCGLMSFGSGQRYRRQALARAGLAPGMKLLDVATGTGLVARAAAAILAEPGAVVGIDPSAGMLDQARAARRGPLVQGQLVQGQMEELPFRAERFEFVTIGFALRHTADLDVTFRECRRVLKPGGRLLVLEISRAPASPAHRVLRFYFTRVLPVVLRLTTRNRHATVLVHYYWDTIAACVPPETIVDTLRSSGFATVDRHVLGGVLSEYVATK